VEFKKRFFFENFATILDKTVGQGLRRNKAQGSLRGGIHCTSSMKVEIQNDEHVTVQYYPAHYGHSNLPATDEPNLSENSLPITNANIHHPHPHHQHQHQQQQENSQHGGDRSSSSSPGSSSTSPSGGSNSNSNHPPLINERQSITTTTSISTSTSNSFFKNMNNNSIQNQLSHCLIISPSFMIDDHPSTNHHHTSVLVVQQNLPTSSSSSSSNSLHTPPTKKEKCVSDIMHEAFQLLSYWPLDHHHGLITTENEQFLPHSRLNMDEHLMF